MTQRIQDLSAQQPRLAAKAQDEQSKATADPQKPLNERLKDLINAAPAMLFMKGEEGQLSSGVRPKRKEASIHEGLLFCCSIAIAMLKFF